MEQRRVFVFYIILTCAVLTRITYLGSVPEGLSSVEVGIGNYLATHLGVSSYLPHIIRIPFALIGILTATLFYKLLLIKTKDFTFAVTTALFYVLAPWSISENRIFSLGSLLSFMIVIAAYFLRTVRFDKRVWLRSVTVFTVFLFLFTLFMIPKDTKEKVDFRRNIASKTSSQVMSRAMVNKYVESVHTYSGFLLANFDFGNYFFGGYPRQRWGIEETQKLLPVLLPLFLFGIIKSKKHENIFYLSASIFYIAFLTAFKLVQPTFGLPLLFIFSILIARGFLSFPKVMRFAVLIIFMFELLVYLNNYMSGKTENMFSPRSVTHTFKLK